MGWGEYSKRKKQNTAMRGKGFRDNFFVPKGLTKKGRFLGEPYFYNAHYIQDAPADKFEPCLQDVGEDCVNCYYAISGKQKKIDSKVLTIRPAWLRVAWNIWDYSKYHALGDKNNRSNEQCTMDDTGKCVHCAAGNEPKMSGLKILSLGSKAADLIMHYDKSLQKRCANCSRGRIKISGFNCPECNADMSYLDRGDAIDTIVPCAECDEQVEPLPIYECSNDCGDPIPSRYTMCDVFVHKNDKNEFEFEWEPEEDPPKELKEAELKDLPEYYTPKPNDIMKTILFSGSRRSMSDRYGGKGGGGDSEDKKEEAPF